MKNEVGKLREIIKSEGLEARVVAYGTYPFYEYIKYQIIGLSLEGVAIDGTGSGARQSAVEKLKVCNTYNMLE